jgi:hypothetical protein
MNCREDVIWTNYPETQASRSELHRSISLMKIYRLQFAFPVEINVNDTYSVKDAVSIVRLSIFEFSFSELSVSLDSVNLHSDVLFLDRT